MPNKTMSKVLQVAFVAVMITSVSFGLNTLNVLAPGMEGTNFLMEIDFDGSNNQAWVQADDPACETTINTDYFYSTSNMILDANDRIDSFLLRSEPGDPGGADNWIRCLTQIGNGATTNNIRCSYHREDDKFQFIGNIGFNPNFDVNVRIEIIQASGLGTADGNIKVYKNGVLSFERMNATNFTACYSRIRWGTGGPLNANTVINGESQHDEFVATR